MAFGSPKLGSIAIDVGSCGLRLMQLSSSGGRLSVVAAGHAPSVAGDDRTISLESNLDTIKRLLREGGFRRRGVVLCVPHGAVRVKNFRLPCMPPEELEQAVRFEAIERFPSLDSEPQIRFFNAGRVDGGQGEQFELIVTAVRGDVVERMLEVAGGAGLCVDAIDFGPAAIFRPFERFLKRAEDAAQVNAFLDLGQGGSRLVVSRGDDVALLRTLDAGLHAVELAVARSLHASEADGRALCAMSRAAAEEQGGAAGADERLPAVRAAMEPAIEQLGKEIGLCLRYFSVTFRGLRPDCVTCVGGGARDAHLLSRLSEIVGTPLLAGNALKHVDADRVFTGVDRRSGQPEWAMAAGLAMRGLTPAGSAAAAAREAVTA